jgi:hypothetical protein
MAQAIAFLPFLILFFVITGCAQPSAIPPASAHSEAILAGDREAPEAGGASEYRIPAMLKRSLGPARMPGSAAAVLAASDLAMGGPARAMNAIDAAIAIGIDNLENAQTTAFKRSIAQVNGEAPAELSRDMTQGSWKNTAFAEIFHHGRLTCRQLGAYTLI